MTENFKKIKMKERFLNEINSIFRTKISDSRLKFVSITKVELAYDYSDLKVYWDTFDSSKKEDIAKAISSCSSIVRYNLSQVIKLRKFPTIKFFYDSQYESEQFITSILDKESSLGKGIGVDSQDL